MASADVMIPMFDPSELYRPELEFQINKDKSKFRNFQLDENDHMRERILATYLNMHTNQTVDFVEKKHAHWRKFDKVKLTVMDALDKLNVLVDESDPDIDLPNIVHAFQTAERIRETYPEMDWFHLIGLVHDLGKVMALYGEPQWAVVGDTFPVGCAFSDCIVYHDTTFDDNPDLHNPKYNTKLGMYEEHCGLDKVRMSWGHDEYLYQVLKNHGTTLPEQALYIVRYHSFYPWYSSGAYSHLCSSYDLEMLPLIRIFNSFDLYTKADTVPDIEKLKPYYQSLIDKYIPGLVAW